jgi:hemolysin III
VTCAIIARVDAIPAPAVKPRLRGISHQYAFFVAVILGAALVVSAPSTRAAIACAIYAITVCGLFGISALYHRITWTEAARKRMRRLDHSMIFVFIAGSYTPISLLALHGSLATAILVTVWAGAAAGVVLKLVWIDAPKWLIAAVYVALGWVAIATFPQLVDKLGWLAVAGLALGGVLYTAGAVIYARGRPNPVPGVFGYHEVFHALVIAAAAAHFAVIAFAVAPRG